MKFRIALVGTGNLATHFARWLAPLSEALYICGRNVVRAREVADSLQATAYVLEKPEDIPVDIDFIIIAVSDKAIPEVASRLPIEPIWLHVAGSVDLDVLGDNDKRGVIYPLQTFSKERLIECEGTRFFVEASTADVLHKIKALLSQLPVDIIEMDSCSRLKLHVAAVIGCNFTNYMLALSADVLKTVDLELDVLAPLIQETVRKAFDGKYPFDFQTGPAVREDTVTINKHIDILNDSEREIYKYLTDKIIERKKSDEQNRL